MNNVDAWLILSRLRGRSVHFFLAGGSSSNALGTPLLATSRFSSWLAPSIPTIVARHPNSFFYD
jgi:hypothetical protein